MKHILSSIILTCFTILVLNSQESQDNQSADNRPKNEITTNFLDLVVAGTLNFNYERFVNQNQSLVLSVNLFDTYGYYDVSYIEENGAFSFQLAYTIYFSNNENSGFYFYPMAKYRTGKITVDDGYGFFDEEIALFEYTYDIEGFALGFGLGYKWLFKNKFVLNINVQIARNLSEFNDSDYLSDVEPRFGINFGYRF